MEESALELLAKVGTKLDEHRQEIEGMQKEVSKAICSLKHPKHRDATCPLPGTGTRRHEDTQIRASEEMNQQSNDEATRPLTPPFHDLTTHLDDEQLLAAFYRISMPFPLSACDRVAKLFQDEQKWSAVPPAELILHIREEMSTSMVDAPAAFSSHPKILSWLKDTSSPPVKRDEKASVPAKVEEVIKQAMAGVDLYGRRRSQRIRKNPS